MKYKSIKVVYLDGWVKEYQKQTLECVIEDIFTDARDPDKIIIEDEIELAWDPYLFNFYLMNGHITDDELIITSKIH
ncbi:MAG: hypothetical protein GYA62_17425 [Bacteroidales bacterium]|nr:hypothetical protein [Bacteroidales bacterium]